MVLRILKCGLLAAAVALPTMIYSGPADAISFGRVQPDGAICRMLFGKPHDHTGRGRGATQAEAMSKAVRRWSAFTRFEYGSRWGDWGIARRKMVECAPGKRGWRCKIEGQPCKH